MNILMTGSKGMLGTEVKKEFIHENVFCTDIEDMNVTNEKKIQEVVGKMPYKPDYIFHFAAETDLEFCERNPEKAYFTNTIGTIFLSGIANQLNIPIIYMSTAGIFSGSESFYTENNLPNPMNIYGKSKLIGESCIRGCAQYYIFRMSWAMGGGPNVDKKFVNKIMTLINNRQTEIFGITDIYGSPTYTKDVAKTIHNCLGAKIPFGVYHTAGIGSASRYDVAKAIVDILKLPAKVVPVTAKEFGEKNKDFPCPRAHNETLISTKDIPSSMRNWYNSLEEYLLEKYND